MRWTLSNRGSVLWRESYDQSEASNGPPTPRMPLGPLLGMKVSPVTKYRHALAAISRELRLQSEWGFYIQALSETFATTAFQKSARSGISYPLFPPNSSQLLRYELRSSGSQPPTFTLTMDRPEPGLVKWSPHTSVDSFVHINLQHRVVQLYEPTGHAKPGRFDYERVSRHDDFPPLTTYDWSPANPGLLAVGTGSGVVNLLKVDDGSNAYLELGLKMNRTCQAVAFNTTGLLAVGLDRVRMDQSLHVWDVSRMSSLDKSTSGFPKNLNSIEEPRYRLEPSVSVSSIKFFEDSPQTLVAGIKAQGLRLHDLRGKLSHAFESVILYYSPHFKTQIASSLSRLNVITTWLSTMRIQTIFPPLPSIIRA